MNKEIWKDIPGYAGFQVSNTNKVKRLAFEFKDSLNKHYCIPENYIVTAINRKGYQRCELCLGGGKKKSFTVHRLVMLAFKGLPPIGMTQINHIDGNKLNNHPDNLEWSNNSHNIKHAWRTGLFKPNLPKGLDSPHAVILVHSEYGCFSNLLQAEKETGISRTRLSKMIRNKIPNLTKYILT